MKNKTAKSNKKNQQNIFVTLRWCTTFEIRLEVESKKYKVKGRLMDLFIFLYINSV